MQFRLARLTADLAADFYRVLEEASEDSRNCMCTAYYGADWTTGGRARRAEMFERGDVDGYLLYEAAKPVGWCQCAPATSGLRVPGVKAGADDEWCVTCMLLRPAYRRRGACGAFLRLVLADLPLRGCKRALVVSHRPGDNADEDGFRELPASACEGAGLRLLRDDPACPLYEATFT